MQRNMHRYTTELYKSSGATMLGPEAAMKRSAAVANWPSGVSSASSAGQLEQPGGGVAGTESSVAHCRALVTKLLVFQELLEPGCP